MYKHKQIVYIKALTPIHAGAGQGIQSVDMPIQRERHSNIPKIEASSLKGSIKYTLYRHLRGKDEEICDYEKNELYTVFGPEDGEDYASAIGFTDAKLLFFPIKSATDIFKLVTCPYIIKRWLEDLRFQNDDNIKKLDIENININELSVHEGMCINNSNKSEILEEYIFEQEKNVDEKLLNIFRSIKGLDIARIVILNDTDFIDLVTMYTEIITRNKIDIKTGTAKGTGLFTEEYLPSETILYFTVLGSPSFNKDNGKSSQEVLDYFNKNVNRVFQVGGNTTIGKGFVKMLDKVGDKNGES